MRASRNTLPKDVLDACAEAFNCETYESGHGTMVRFKKGMEPGSQSYKANRDLGDIVAGRRVRRGNKSGLPDGNVVTTTTTQKGSPTDGNGNGQPTTGPSLPYSSTRVNLDDKSVQYGSIGASGNDGALRLALNAACNPGTCNPADKELTTTYISPPADSDPYVPRDTVTLIINAHGVYENETERDRFIDGIVAAASKGEKCVDTRWWDCANPNWGYALDDEGFPFSTRTCPRGKIRQCTHTSFISIHRYEYNTYGSKLQGFMYLNVKWKQSTQGVGTNWCSVITGVLGGIAGIVGAIPGIGAAAGVTGGFFGIVAASCTS
ncbi:MAG: hypothetical protein Q9166_007285 [cf. Caloplaca sp. 2 TL-2023]